MDRDFLCDTDVLSMVRDPDPKYARLRAWWDATPVSRRVMTDSTFEELWFGAENLGKRRKRPDPARAAVIRHGIEGLRRETREMSITREVVAEYASLRAEPSLDCLWKTDPRSERVNSGGDVWLAAFFRVTGIAIASRNERDFLKIQEVAPLPGLYDPFDDVWVKLVVRPGRAYRPPGFGR